MTNEDVKRRCACGFEATEFSSGMASIENKIGELRVYEDKLSPDLIKIHQQVAGHIYHSLCLHLYNFSLIPVVIRKVLSASWLRFSRSFICDKSVCTFIRSFSSSMVSILQESLTPWRCSNI